MIRPMTVPHFPINFRPAALPMDLQLIGPDSELVEIPGIWYNLREENILIHESHADTEPYIVNNTSPLISMALEVTGGTSPSMLSPCCPPHMFFTVQYIKVVQYAYNRMM